MSRKDYALIAKGFAAAFRFLRSEAEVEGWTLAVAQVAKELQADNPRFDRVRFMQACGCVFA